MGVSDVHHQAARPVARDRAGLLSELLSRLHALLALHLASLKLSLTDGDEPRREGKESKLFRLTARAALDRRRESGGRERRQAALARLHQPARLFANGIVDPRARLVAGDRQRWSVATSLHARTAAHEAKRRARERVREADDRSDCAYDGLYCPAEELTDAQSRPAFRQISCFLSENANTW